MPNLGPLEIGLIVVVIFLLFGATRLPKLGRSMGQSIRGFKQGLNEDVADDELATAEQRQITAGDPAETA
jgi:sec-independent protein translocase protein TatA